MGLGYAAKMWATPSACDATGTTGGGQNRSLRTDVRMWPTPTSTAGDGRSEQSVDVWRARQERTKREKGINNGLPLNVAVKMWPTPQARDWRSPDPLDSPRTKRKLRQGWSFNLNDVAGGQLNPDFVEILMGLPPGWTALGEEK